MSAMPTQRAWPSEVPVLTARDICRTTFYDLCGRRCLLGWIGETFTISRQRCAIAAVRRAMETDSADIAYFNDDVGNTKTEIARVWNRAMAKLDYVVGNPEAKKKR